MFVKFRKICESAKIPSYTRIGDAGLDLSSIEKATIPPQKRTLIHTGLEIEIEDGYCGLVLPRSGNAVNYGVTVINSPGLIDSNYRGEIKIGLYNTDIENEFTVHIGDRIAQLLIIPTCHVDVKQSLTLSSSNRGKQGFGSSGI